MNAQNENLDLKTVYVYFYLFIYLRIHWQLHKLHIFKWWADHEQWTGKHIKGNDLFHFASTGSEEKPDSQSAGRSSKTHSSRSAEHHTALTNQYWPIKSLQ